MRKPSLVFVIALCAALTSSIAQTFNNVGPAYFINPNYPFNSQLQTAQNNILMIEGNNVAGSNAARNNINVGIGVFPATAPVSRLHLNNINAVPVTMRITNSTTGATAADGFTTGILATGDAVLNQLENLSMRFHTNALERMRIQANGLVGINTTAPTNQLEVNSSFGSCTSGLTLTQLTSTCVPIPNPGLGVLAVDATGKVIYVPSTAAVVTGANNGLSLVGGNVQLGGACGSGLGALTSTREIPMAGFNINHTMAAGSTSQINIGFPVCTTVVSRFTVNNDFQQVAGAFFSNFSSGGTVGGGAFRAQNNGPGNATGIATSALTTTAGANAIGINARSVGGGGFNSFYNIAVNALSANASFASLSVNADITGSSSSINQGINVEIFSGTNASANNSGANLTVNTPGSVNFGVYANAVGATNNYAVYGSVATSSGSTGVGTPPGPDYAGFFNGDVLITNMYGISDQNLKKDVQQINHSLDIIKRLEPVTYSFDKENHRNIALSDKKQYGFISQEVQKILPELTSPALFPALYDSTGKVTTNKEEYLALNYQGFIAIIVDAMQQQQKQIEAQQQQIDHLTSLLQGQPANPVQGNVNEQDVTLTNEEVVVLDQNAPNPFTNQTVINYYIPENSGTAQMQFFDMNGKMIRTTNISDKGNGRMVVYAGELRVGVYSYSLVVDGKVVDTKRMVKAE